MAFEAGSLPEAGDPRRFRPKHTLRSIFEANSEEATWQQASSSDQRRLGRSRLSRRLARTVALTSTEPFRCQDCGLWCCQCRNGLTSRVTCLYTVISV
jgi:hypothetical protein